MYNVPIFMNPRKLGTMKIIDFTVHSILLLMFMPIVLSLMNHECYEACPSWAPIWINK